MAEIRRGLDADDAGGNARERLPWLEPVEDEDEGAEETGLGALALVGLAVLIGLALVVTAVVLFRRWHAGHADLGQVIHAPATPYKTKPADPGGLKVDGSGVVAERTGTGNDLDAPLDLGAMPEQPVTGPGSGRAPVAAAPAITPTQRTAAAQTPRSVASATTAEVPARPDAPARPGAPPVAAVPPAPPVPAAPASPTAVTAALPAEAGAGAGSTIQLGALNSEARARAVWKTLSGRFAYLQPLTMAITPVKVGDATLYRLRASGGDARALCARLRIAGETCVAVN